MLKLIAQNKYKLMAFIVGLYLVVDVWLHKGQARVLFPKNFPEFKAEARSPKIAGTLINKNKAWKKGVNTLEILDQVKDSEGGFECDVYFDTITNSFDVYHDPGKSTGLRLNSLLVKYEQKKMTAGIWFDIKNLSEKNAQAALTTMIQLRNKFGLQNKMLIESHNPRLLPAFSDSGFFTSFYLPMFNPYLLDDPDILKQADSISAILKDVRVDALSGYYFQSAFCSRYFPKYPFLTWIEEDPYSLVNRIFKIKIRGNKTIYIALEP